jgi:adenine-specific DNA-methyltransferase
MELNQEEIDKQAKQNEGVFENDEQKVVGGRKLILVQLPEKIDNKKEAFKAGYKKISDITIKRVKRAGEKYQSVDNGFKVLELTDNPDRESLWSLGNLPNNENNNQFVLTHLALMYGYGLNYEATKISEKEIYMMKSEIPKTKDAIVILEQDPLTMRDTNYERYY